MQLKPRILALALGLALAPLSSLAQDIELLSEADVNIEITFTTSVTTQKGTGVSRVDSTRAYNSKLPHADIVRSLLNLAPTASISGWRLAAVRPLAADLEEIEARFALYLVNDADNIRQAVPLDKFQTFGNYSVTNAVITHSTRNITTVVGEGTRTEDTFVRFTQSFVRKEVPAVIDPTPITETETGAPQTYKLSTKTDTAFTVDSLLTRGFATVTFQTRSTEPVFSFALKGVRFNGRGDFTGTLLNTVTATRKYTNPRNVPDKIHSQITDTNPTPARGLASIQINVLAAKLVEGSRYPDVDFYYENF